MLLFIFLLQCSFLYFKSVIMAELITFPGQFVTMYNQLSLKELMIEFQELDAELDKQEYETRKLMIVNRVLLHLKGEIDVLPEKSLNSSSYSQALLKTAYLFCLIFGGLENGASSFLFSSNLFIAIPGVSQLALYSLISVYALLDAILFYAFEVSFLKKALGIIARDNQDILLNETYELQLKAVMDINSILNDKITKDWDPKDYAAYCEARTIFNAHLLKKHGTMKDYVSSNLRIGLEKGVVLFGALSCVADSYFMAKTALLMLHVTLMTSPLGFALVVGMVVASLVLYCTMRLQSMSKLLNPDRKSHNALQEGLIDFEKYVYRKSYVPNRNRMFKPSCSAADKTNPSMLSQDKALI